MECLIVAASGHQDFLKRDADLAPLQGSGRWRVWLCTAL